MKDARRYFALALGRPPQARRGHSQRSIVYFKVQDQNQEKLGQGPATDAIFFDFERKSQT